MKKTWTLVVAVLATIATTQVNAQKFGVRAGVNFANMSTSLENDKNTNELEEEKFNIGYNVGVVGEIDFHENFGIETGLIVNTKGQKLSTKVSESSINLLYLDIPVSFKGMYNVTDGVQIFAKAGPYLGVGLTGKSKLKIGDVETETDIEFGDDLVQFKRLDYGLNMGLGTEIGGFIVEATYKLGLADIDNSDITKTHHHVIGISLGYNLGF